MSKAPLKAAKPATKERDKSLVLMRNTTPEFGNAVGLELEVHPSCVLAHEKKGFDVIDPADGEDDVVAE